MKRTDIYAAIDEERERQFAMWGGAHTDIDQLRTELIQVAAVAVAWLEAL